MTAAEYRDRRERLGLTQVQLAARLGVSRRTIINREQGRLITREAKRAIKALK